MVRPIAVAVLALSAIAVIPDSANAQRKGLVDVSPPHYRNGLWLEGALGWGEEKMLDMSFSKCSLVQYIRTIEV